ncbi:ATP-binding protein [Bifidobacterium animalis subsp. lactis]|uniref:ATP-binding protein n=1 Tax=Bifidobacterium animalis TaxID=28025 RepID=UPI0030D17F3D
MSETSDIYASIELMPPHWALASRQLVNWGSYDGYHVFEPSTAGNDTVTLLTGQSESGKSTLVDAQVSLLYPANAAFNKASNAGRSDRSDYSYLLGLRGIRNNNGHDEPVYLRGRSGNGEPYAVWGAIVDHYVDTANSGALWIAKFMYLPADGAPESMVKLYVVSGYAIDPRLMDAHREERFSVPLIKQVYPGVTVYNYAKQFHEDIWKRFGLTESACRLLHRMQASDAPSQLDDIFRKGVLNEPRAVEFGKLAIDDYEQFAENFSSMERTRKRVRQLEAIASEFAEYESAERGVRELSTIAPEQGDSARIRTQWLDDRIHADITEVLPEYEQHATDCSASAQAAKERAEQMREQADSLNRQLQGMGGDEISRLEDRIRDAQRRQREVLGRRELLASRFSASGEALPESRGQWDALVAEYTQFESEYQQRKTELHGLQYPLIDAQKKAEQRTKALEKDLERKRQSKTRISSDMDEARNMIARATGLSPQELPYAAELMDVGEENEEWRTAMNVAYRSLATVILVDSCHENGFAAKVSQIPQEALPRRNWRFVDTSVHVEAEEREGWLSSKLTFNVESPFADWLRARVTEARYDAWCVEAIDDTNETTRQVQRDGQIKEGRKGSHGTKNMPAVIGFVTDAYLRDLEADIAEARKTRDAATRDLEQYDVQLNALEQRHSLAQTLQDHAWNDIDAYGVEEEIASLQQRVDELEQNPELAQLNATLKVQQQEMAKANSACYAAEDKLKRANAAVRSTRQWLEAYDRRTQSVERRPLNEACGRLLERGYLAYFGESTQSANERMGRILGLDGQSCTSLGGHVRENEACAKHVRELLGTLAQTVGRQVKELATQRDNRKRSCEASMRSYLDQYASGDERVSAEVENERYFRKDLEELKPGVIGDEATNVEYMNSLDKMLQGLVQLQTMLKLDQQRITEQIGKINHLLERYPFGARGGRLSIVVQVHRPDAKFTTALTGQIGRINAFKANDEHDVERCRKLFAGLAGLIEMLRGSFDEYAGNGRGNANLDPRKRSRFFGSVTNPDGVVESINSTGGGSGGYLQELTSFAYGAALMYLLATDNATEPSYATVFLDEALIKADGQYTRRALSVLPGLGFQVIVSAPESKTGEIMGSASKVIVARKDQASGRTTLMQGDLLGDADGDESSMGERCE